MITFEPTSLERRLKDALGRLVPCLRPTFKTFQLGKDGQIDAPQNDGQIINEDFLVPDLFGDQVAEDLYVTVRDLLNLASPPKGHAQTAVTVFHGQRATFFPVASSGTSTLGTLMSLSESIGKLQFTGEDNKRPFSVRLHQGRSPIQLACESARNEKFRDVSGMFCSTIIVFHGGKLNEQEARNLALWFLFELSASYELDFKLTEYDPIPVQSFLEDLPDLLNGKTISFEFAKRTVDFKIRPARMGPGMDELIASFLDATSATNIEYKVIGFVKVIEFVSATVVRKAAHEKIRQRLMSPKALSPDAKFIDELMLLLEEHRENRPDHVALKLAVETCCDAVELANEAPPSLLKMKDITGTSEAGDRREALHELAERLSATRNQLAHAKPNYDLTGKEVPKSELEAFCALARKAAAQCLHWFSGLPAHTRVC